ncbi:protein of unknown function DUF214 [Coriobacterium glomerans PW2]|uniref:ABC3 transporter permease protein domain-containing protein n=1 Tax=Coriobacterium glomerans (strain ATCC 49209 / DSM 20642 / JCM 10262 / PW2) TaxID=700015 RepID=F2N9H8_CORGP|nr:FtsX-like permease family protein [Coriobacterium glomerans]AEB07007.1 protein of unknown function DUF214 [Coriobacterium glomerans PW2]
MLFRDQEIMVFNDFFGGRGRRGGAAKSSYEQEVATVVAKRIKIQATTRMTSELQWADEHAQRETIRAIQDDQCDDMNWLPRARNGSSAEHGFLEIGIASARCARTSQAVAALSCWAASTISGASPTAGMTTALLLPGLLVATLVPAAPMILPALLDSWSRLVPGSWGSAWYLARRSATWSIGMSMSVETPIMVGFGLVAGLFSVIRVLAAHARALGATDTSGFRLDVSTTLLLLGGPVVLCALSAAVSVIMSSRSRTRDVALMTVAGADARTIVATSALEALIHALSASAVGAASVLATCAVVDGAYGLPFSVGIDFMPGLVVSSVGFALVLAATLAPAIANLRRPPARALSSGQ